MISSICLVCHREVARAGAGLDVDSETGAQLPEAPFHFAPLHHGSPPHGAAEKHVRGGRHVGDDGQFLVDRGDACALLGAGAVLVDRVAENLDAALVGGVGAGERLDQRRFSRAVLAHEAVDLALVEHEVDLLQRVHAGERLRHALDADGVEPGRRCCGRVDPCLQCLPRSAPAPQQESERGGPGRTLPALAPLSP